MRLCARGLLLIFVGFLRRSFAVVAVSRQRFGVNFAFAKEGGESAVEVAKGGVCAGHFAVVMRLILLLLRIWHYIPRPLMSAPLFPLNTANGRSKRWWLTSQRIPLPWKLLKNVDAITTPTAADGAHEAVVMFGFVAVVEADFDTVAVLGPLGCEICGDGGGVSGL